MKQYLDLELTKKVLSSPYRGMYIRELAGNVGISPATASRFIRKLEREGIVNVEKRGKEKIVKVNMNSPKTRALKLFFSISDLQDSGVLSYLYSKKVKSAVLYGSRAKGTDDENSDFDLFVIANKCKELSETQIERLLGKKVNLICVHLTKLKQFKRENPAFYEEIVIYGFPLIGDKVML